MLERTWGPEIVWHRAFLHFTLDCSYLSVIIPPLN
jgi:hypothetical protein